MVQMFCTYVALGGLALMLGWLLWLGIRDQIKAFWRGLERIGKLIVCVGIAVFALYGGSKGFWNRVKSGGGDEPFQVTGIYTAVSNEVDETVSPPITNRINLVRIEWLGTGATEDTPVSIRESETNEWVEVGKLEPVERTMEHGTNVLQFVTVRDFGKVAYWWFGTDRPAIIITEEGIEIRAVVITTREVHFEFICGEAAATEFEICRKELNTQDWEVVGTVHGRYGEILSWTGRMFTVDRTYDWIIRSTISEGGDE